jgi:membrane associated rhomboid family serine protease
MKTVIKRFFDVVTPGTFSVLLTILAGFVLVRLRMGPWLWLEPHGFWHGRIWTVVTHAFLPANVIDLLFNGLFLFMLGVWIEKAWSRFELWGFCLLSALATGLFRVAVTPGSQVILFGTMPLVFGLLVAWARLFGHERLLFMGVWEMTVRQCALLVGIIDIIIMATCPCFGWINCLAVCMAALGGWLYLTLRWKRNLAARSQAVNSERISRLEL